MKCLSAHNWTAFIWGSGPTSSCSATTWHPHPTWHPSPGSHYSQGPNLRCPDIVPETCCHTVFQTDPASATVLLPGGRSCSRCPPCLACPFPCSWPCRSPRVAKASYRPFQAMFRVTSPLSSNNLVSCWSVFILSFVQGRRPQWPTQLGANEKQVV